MSQLAYTRRVSCVLACVIVADADEHVEQFSPVNIAEIIFITVTFIGHINGPSHNNITFGTLYNGWVVTFGTSREGSVAVRSSSTYKTHSLGWLRGSVVERRSSAGVLSLSCARPVADG